MSKKWDYYKEKQKARNRKKYKTLKEMRISNKEINEAKERGAEIFKTPTPLYSNCLSIRAKEESILDKEVEIQKVKGWIPTGMVSDFGESFLTMMLPKGSKVNEQEK